jgi:hypothetical protein
MKGFPKHSDTQSLNGEFANRFVMFSIMADRYAGTSHAIRFREEAAFWFIAAAFGHRTALIEKYGE